MDKKETATIIKSKVDYSEPQIDAEETIKKMEQDVDEKLNSMRSFVPFVITIITSLLAYLFTSKISVFNTLTYIVVCYLLVCLVMIFIAYYPRNKYNGDAEKGTSLSKLQGSSWAFRPWNMASYIFLSDTDFTDRLEYFISRKLEKNELIHACFLKQKINEYRYKKRCVSLSYKVVIGGALFLILAFGAYFLIQL